ncbi:MAG: cupin domain-containing protein [Bacteroidota bacterium]
MKDTARRDFIQKMGLFSSLCLSGIRLSHAKTHFPENTEGLILKANEGETWYIGNERKAEVKIKVSKRAHYTPEIALLTEKIPPGDGIPVHKHLHEEEFIFIQKGTVEITLGESVNEGAAGDLIYVPRTTWHGFENKGQEELMILFGYSPAGVEDYFRVIGTQSIDQELGFTAEDWARTNKKFGVVYKDLK